MKYFSILFFSLFFLFSGCEKDVVEDTEVDLCASTVCQNGGYCSSSNGDCVCPDFFYGSNCENQMNGFVIDSIEVQSNSLYDENGDLIEGAGEGNPDLVLGLSYLTSSGYVTIQNSAVNYEVPVATKTVFYPNWTFSTGVFSTYYKLSLRDRDTNPVSYPLIRSIGFNFTNENAKASQTINSSDGQFSATFYYSYQ